MPTDTTELSRWLIGTVPGVFVLGVVGSVASYVIIELAKYIGRKLFAWMMSRARSVGKWAVASALRPFARSLALVTKYADPKNQAKLIVWCVGSLVAFWTVFALFFISLVTTIAVSIQTGLDAPILLAFLIGVTGLAFIFLVANLAESMAAHWFLFYHDVTAINKHLKEDDTVFMFSVIPVAIDEVLAEKAREQPGKSPNGHTPPDAGVQKDGGA